MAVYTLNIFDLSRISTDDPDGFSNNGGYQFDVGTSTVTIAPGSLSQALSVEDMSNGSFDDDDGGQTLASGATINGIAYGAGTMIEAEYDVIVRDSLGNDYVLRFVSLSGDAWNIQGFVVQGPMPPAGEPLTVVGTADMTQNSYSYASSNPSCFVPGTRIETSRGPLRVEALKAGDHLLTADAGAQPLRMVLTAGRGRLAAPGGPVRIRQGALGPALPSRDLLLSPQHRVHVAALGALVPARALTVLPGVRELRRRPAAYVHLVLDRHALILAEGLGCESFWPGPVALAAMPAALRARVRRVMGPSPAPALPLMGVGPARRALAALTGPAPRPGPCPTRPPQASLP